MRQIALLAMTCIAMAFSASQLPNDGKAVKLTYYELYSWQELDGTWNFCVLPNTSREKSVEEVYDKRIG